MAAMGSSPIQVMDESTIDESILKTIWRDVVTIGRNLRTVLIPINWKFTAQEQALRNWDLWGPLVGPAAHAQCNPRHALVKHACSPRQRC